MRLDSVCCGSIDFSAGAVSRFGSLCVRRSLVLEPAVISEHVAQSRQVNGGFTGGEGLKNGHLRLEDGVGCDHQGIQGQISAMDSVAA